MTLEVTSEHALAAEQAATRLAAITAFYESNHEPLVAFARKRAYVYKIPDCRLDAEAVAHEAIIRVIERWDTVENPRAYVYKVARSLIWHAGQEDIEFTDLASVDDQDVDDADDFDPSAFLRRWRAESVALDDPAEVVVQNEAVRGLKDLPPKQRAATYLRVIEDRPSKEIGEIIGSKPGAVDANVSHGVRSLREAYLKTAFAVVGVVTSFIALWGGLKKIDLYLAGQRVDPTAMPTDDPTGFPSGGIDTYPIGDYGSAYGAELSWMMIIVGGLLVLLGIGAIALILMRRNSDEAADDENDEDGRPSGPRR